MRSPHAFLIIQGEDDPVGPNARIMACLTPDSTLEFVDCGQMLTLTRNPEVSGLVSRFTKFAGALFDNPEFYSEAVRNIPLKRHPTPIATSNYSVEDEIMSLKEKLQHYAATMKSDFEASLDLLADDIVWINLLPDHVPFGGTYTGKEELVGYFTQMAETFVIGDYVWEVFDYIESGDTLVMVGFEKDGKAIPTGKVFDLHFVWVIRFNDRGQICYLREHNDTAAIGDAFKS